MLPKAVRGVVVIHPSVVALRPKRRLGASPTMQARAILTDMILMDLNTATQLWIPNIRSPVVSRRLSPPDITELTAFKGQSVPITVVEKVDPFTPSYGEVPGTLAYDARKADAAPDVVMATNVSEKAESAHEESPKRPPVPKTKVTIVDDPKGIPGTEAFEKHKLDAEPDVIEQQSDEGKPLLCHMCLTADSVPRSPTLFGGSVRWESAVTQPSAGATPTLFPAEYPPRGQSDEGRQEQTGGLEATDEANVGHPAAAADDFDDFEEGGVNDDFGDFDDGFAVETVGEDAGPAGSVPVVSTRPLAVSLAVSIDNCTPPFWHHAMQLALCSEISLTLCLLLPACSRY